MITDFMKQVASIYELQAETDSSGGVYQTWVHVSDSICLICPYKGGVDRDHSKDGSAASHIIFIPNGWSLSAKNQIRVSGSTYNVIRCKDVNSMGRHTELECLLETS